MIITISGKAGSGKSTIARLLAKGLKLKHYSIGDIMRKMAKKRKISLLKLSKIAESDRKIDKELDERQTKLGKEQNNFVIDGRLSAYFIPNANFKIFLDCDDKTRAKRILRDSRQEEKGKNINEMVKKVKQREDSERKRYKKYYGYDYHDKKNYGYVIDTTNSEVNKVLNEILGIIR